MRTRRLFRFHELAFRTQYAEVRERAFAEPRLLPGTPGTLTVRRGTGFSYWYRVFYDVPGKQSEELVGRENDTEALQAMTDRMALSTWINEQVSKLRKLGFQVADKSTARVLVELHNKDAFGSGLILVGTLSYMAWLNELGAMAVSARTLHIDLARRLKLAAPLPFLKTMKDTGLPFAAVPGLPVTEPSTSVKLPGVHGLRVDILAPGKILGKAISVPEMDWTAQAVPYYDYLLEDPERGAMLAGGHCVPVMLPQAGRLVWHKLCSSADKQRSHDKAEKDRQQAMVLGAALVETDDLALKRAFLDAPVSMTKRIRRLLPDLLSRAENHPELRDALRECLAG